MLPPLMCPLTTFRILHTLTVFHLSHSRSIRTSLSRSFRVYIRWTTREHFLQWTNPKLFHLSKATKFIYLWECCPFFLHKTFYTLATGSYYFRFVRSYRRTSLSCLLVQARALRCVHTDKMTALCKLVLLKIV